MKVLLKTSLGLALGLLLAGSATAQDKKADPTGKWTWTSAGRDGATRTNVLVLKLEGEKLTGTVSGRQQDTAIEEAKIKGDEISFQVTREFNGNKMVSKYTAKIAGDTMKGKSSFDRNGEVQEREFEAKREVAKKP